MSKLFPFFLFLLVAVGSWNFAIAQDETDPVARELSPIEFRRHVLPVFSKIGCNSGACHGALAGKGGFKLSLNAYDPVGDHFNITKQSVGRRIELNDPGSSLLLTKPTGAVPHKGGLKIEIDSEAYRILSQWIANGAQGPSESQPSLTELIVTPAQIQLDLGKTMPLKVEAVYDDGSRDDVTQWARFSSTLTPVVSVDDSGIVTVVGRGEASIVVWFSSLLSTTTITSPFEFDIPDTVYSETIRRNFIDELILQKLKSLKLAPAPRCDDATFLRRAFLDTIGVLPTVEETETFLANECDHKRDDLIESLLSREEFVDYWTYRWSDVLLISGKQLRPAAIKAYYTWIRGHVEANTPWNQVVHELVTAQGSSYENGATNFYALHQSPEDMAENVSQAFLGLSIGCAKCHNHPLEKWTNDQYYAFANLFARVRAKGWGGDPRNGDGLRTVYLTDSGELTQPLTGRPQPPAPLDGQPLAFDDQVDRREHLAKWLTAEENPYFSRSIVNRVWANFMGRGLVENVDDMRVSNPASNEPLLAELSKFLIANRYDLKQLMRTILQSEAYQRSSLTTPENDQDDRFYARYYPRRLMAEVLLDAVSQVTNVPTEFSKIAFDGADVHETEEYPIGTRAIELYDSAVLSDFLSTFGRNKRDIVCECERSNKPSMTQVLMLANGKTLNEKLKEPTSCVGQYFDENVEFNSVTIVRHAYLKTLSRQPTDLEMKELISEFDIVPESDRRGLVEDLFWSLMSSREFLFQH